MHKTRDRASGAAVWISLCLVTSGAAHAQIAPPECEECEPYEARYHPREVVLVARKRGLIPEVYVPQLWYARDARFGLGVLAWNETGAIAGTRFAADGVTPRPFFWTPSIVPISNLAAGTYDLLTLAHGASADGLKGFAWDISDSFTIVGGAGDDVEPGEVRARAWEATQPALSCAFEFDLDPAPPRSRPWSVALAIEPKPDVPNELEIVGVGGQECAEWREPFQFHLNLPNCDALLCAVTELAPSFEPPPDLSMPYVSSAREWACDITNHEFLPVGAFDRQSVAQDPLSNPCSTFDPYPFACYMPMQVGAHFSSVAATLYRIDTNEAPLQDERTGVRSITSYQTELEWQAKLSGYCWREIITGGSQEESESDDGAPVGGHGFCPQYAAVWNYDQLSPPYALLPRERAIGSTPEVSADEPIAQRWRPIECICKGEVVLGWDGLDQLAHFWTRSRASGDFVLFDAADILAADPGAAPSAGLIVTDVLQLYDIAATGEILALVRRTYGNPDVFDIFASILGLHGDINGDRLRNAADLSLLLSAWGQSEQLAPDLDLSGTVDVADLSILLSLMGVGPQRLLLPGDAALASSYCMLSSDEICVAASVGFGSDESRREACLCCALGAFGFTHTDQFTEWARTADPALLYTTCECVGAMIRNMMEETL